MARETVRRGDGTPVPALDAATVLVLRDGDDGVEVLVQERHVETDFVGGALVFPGGRIEQADRDLPHDLTTGGAVGDVVARLGTDEHGARGLLVGVAREAFEEAGVLYALRDGEPVPASLLDDEDVATTRAALAARDDRGDLAGLLRRAGCSLDLDQFVPYAWWVTPEESHRRYDTRFFVARVPAGQEATATADHVETTSARWIGAAAALTAGEQGRFTIIFPTRRVLQRLARAGTVDEVLATARTEPITRRMPTMVDVDGTTMVHLPGEEPEVP